MNPLRVFHRAQPQLFRHDSVLDMSVRDLHRSETAHDRIRADELLRAPKLRTVAELIGEPESHIPAAASVVGLRRGIRPLLDPAVLERIGVLTIDDLPPFIRDRIRARLDAMLSASPQP